MTVNNLGKQIRKRMLLQEERINALRLRGCVNAPRSGLLREAAALSVSRLEAAICLQTRQCYQVYATTASLEKS